MTNILNWKNTGTSPTGNLIENGYQGGDSPQAEHFNYIFNNFSTCIKETRSGFDIPDNIKKLSEIIEPGRYVGNKTYEDGPVINYITPVIESTNADGTKHSDSVNNFILNVSLAPDNQIYQSLYVLSTDPQSNNTNNQIVFERFGRKDSSDSSNIKINWMSWKKINLNGSTLLWSGCWFMNQPAIEGNKRQTVELTEEWQKVQNQPKGIVLVFSCYVSGGSSYDNIYGLQSFFVPKETIGGSACNPKGGGHSFFLTNQTYCGFKYLYIENEAIKSHQDNNYNGTKCGITYTGDKFVLRYVIGV